MGQFFDLSLTYSLSQMGCVDSVDPEDYHLVGGTLVIHGSPDASTLAGLEKIIRIGVSALSSPRAH